MQFFTLFPRQSKIFSPFSDNVRANLISIPSIPFDLNEVEEEANNRRITMDEQQQHFENENKEQLEEFDKA
ncbi:unnamed protein product, partial [Didymodactylos carnosus]